MRGWAEISIQTAQEAVEAVANILHEAGAGGVVIEDPAQLVARADELGVSELLKAAPLNGNVTVKAYLPVNVKLEARIKALQRELNRVLKLLAVPGEISLQEVAEEEWATAWKTYYKPFRVGEHIVIKPAWEECGTAANEIVIELDPGLAFGTGNHPTTVMALTLLERYLQPGAKVFDIGTGSGILSIAAAKLGAAEVAAVDVDPVALEAAWENCQRNHVINKVTVLPGDLFEELSGRADLVVANITADVLLLLIDDLPLHLGAQGAFVGSGVIESQFDDIKEALTNKGLKLLEIMGQEEWVAFAAGWEEA
ncbi:MAG: 50S ribosomal protein L11 methyltransferase [bacterium]|jgi:ribosomal protein L11 methyltransferase|nr:50S ribosomal protein L11 methyltransferase [Bacillota bacterium]